jgi:hypothetical protein
VASLKRVPRFARDDNLLGSRRAFGRVPTRSGSPIVGVGRQVVARWRAGRVGETDSRRSPGPAGTSSDRPLHGESDPRAGGRGSGVGFGDGQEEVVLVVFDGVADGLAQVVGAEGVGVFVLGEVDGLHESLGQVGDGAGGSGLYIAAEDGGDEASQGGTEIAGGEKSPEKK